MRGLLPSQWGSATNLPTADYQVARYATGDDGRSIRVEEGGVPAQAVAPLTYGTPLAISRTGKPGGDPSLSVDYVYNAQSFYNSPQGTGVVPEATIARVRDQRVTVKLAARGYVDPGAMAERKGQRGTELIAADLQFIP